MAILKDLIVHGSSRFLNKIYASEIQTPLIEAEAGIFKKLKADDATVVGLLDVQGQMHTNSWTNSNIATIDGSFYITPTLSSSSGTVSFSSATAATFTGTYSAVSSLYIGNNTASTVQWTSGSKILITGEVQVDGEWIPLGTLLGTLNSTNPTTSMPVVSITDNRNNTSNILTDIYSLKGNASLSYRNLKVSLYQRADSSKYYPLGIFMTALGQNGKTFLDIYGGVNELTTSYGGYANPNVRIGNLSGLPAITTAAGNFTPVGWGIYTTNGYFSGTIVSNTGVIGGWKLGASSLYNGTTGLNNNTVGIYLGTDGIRNYSTSTQYVNITGGKIKAQGVDLTGKITASSGSIGGWNIGTDTNKSLYYGNQTPGATTTNLVLSPTSATNSNAIGGSGTGLKWFISAGKVFGVTTAGALYATSGKIGGFDIGTTYIKNTKTSYSETTNNGVWVGTDGIGLGKGLFYVTNAGALTAKSGSIAGWSFNTSSLYKTNATPGYNTSTMVISTGTASTNNIGGGGTASKTWMISAGTGFGVTTAGTLYCNDAHISGEITATSGTIGGIQLDSNGKLWITDANVSGKISSNHIDASSISIGMNQVTNLSTALEGKQAAGDYATNTALSNVSTTANAALSQSTWYAECSTAGGTLAKEATITPTTTAFILQPGVTVNVKFSITNSAGPASLTLNINQTGAKPMKYINNGTLGNLASKDHIKAGNTYPFIYDGTNWIIQTNYSIANTNTIGVYGATKLKAGTNASNASATTVYRWTLIMKKTAGSNPTWVSLVTSSNAGTSKTRYTGGLYPDQIFYMSANYSNSPYGCNTGASIGDSYAALGFDLRYSTNCGSTLAIGKPVYLVGEINPLNGLFYLDSTWWTQTEPTTENGKTYIYLGNAYSTTNVYLVEKNPLMRYYRGAFRTEEQIAGMTATSYITYINANDGIKVHNESDMLNYLQLNSDAISMYRNRGDGINSDEVLRIDDTGIRVGKANEAHFSLTSSRLTGYGDNNNVYFDVGKSSNTTIQLFYGDGDRTSFEMGPLVKEIVSVKKENNTLIQGTDYTIDTVSIWYDIYFKQEPALNSTVKVSYESTNKEFIYTVGSSQNITTEQVVNPEGRYKTTIVSQSVYKVREISQKSSMGEDWWNPIYNYGSELEGNVYKYTFYTQTAIENGEKFKLTYLLSDDSNFTPDIETKEYTWDTSRQGSLNLTVSGVNEIQTVKVNNVSVNYTTEGPLYKDYVILNTALGQDEKIEVEFKTRNYNSEYYSTYFNFSNMNKENSVKGIGSASFGSENVNKGVFCLAEGVGNTVTGYASHAEGYNNVVAGSHAHAEGWSVKALGENSHAGGSNTTATGLNSFVHGNHLNAIYPNSAAFGYGNSAQSQLFSIGMGLSQNAFSVNQDGDIQIGGRLLSGTTYENRIPLFKVVERTFTGHGIGRNGGMTRSRDITIAGYKPIAILGIVVGNSPGHPTSGQVDASWCVVSRFWIGYDYTNDHSDYKTDSIYYYIWNLFTGTNVSGGVSVDITFKFLYISQTAYMGLTQSQTTPNN